ncbi:MAG: pyruvate kinase alpha/beta domain-containing protein, partial [Clostridiaceae bacterium]
DSPIIAVTPSETVAKKLALSFGVYPIIAEKTTSTDEMMDNSVKAAEVAGLVKKGDTVVLAAGVPVEAGATNLLKISVVE